MSLTAAPAPVPVDAVEPSSAEGQRGEGADAADANDAATDELRANLRERLAMSPLHLMLLALGCVLFMYHNYMPLFHSDLWGHVAYGDWILRHGRLPSEEPFVPLAAGVPVIDTAWLGQIVLAGTERLGGPEGLGHLFALTALGTYLVLVGTFYHQTRRIGVAVLAAMVVLGIGWSRHAILRPECFGSLCFALTIAVVAWADVRSDRRAERAAASAIDRGFPWWVWLAVPVLFALWANLHGSFIVGVALLACYAAGRGWEVVWETGDVLRVFRDRTFLRWTGVTELAVAGTLVNPLGMDLLLQTVLFPSHPNLKDIVEWYPLKMVSLEGIPMAASWVLTAFLLRHSRRRMTAADVFVLLLFNTAVCLRVRMIAWYGPAMMLVLAPHLADVCEQVAGWNAWSHFQEAFAVLRARSFRITLFAGLLLWLTFAFSPISRPFLGGRARADDQLYSADTPLGVTAYLREHPPQGMVLAPQWWGDWLVWKGPPGIQVLVTTNSVHVVPNTVWKDYLAMAGGLAGLERRLNHYRVNTIVVGKKLQQDLLRVVEQLAGWEVVYEDEVGLVAVRKPRTAVDDAGLAVDPSPTATAETPDALDFSRAVESPDAPDSQTPASEVQP
uniref:Glycosyltransferase RgtA/B/C/D-like domain-containing protein n=1 Tax=Schlesneria paludicola TaxID=360056 RepID=A0A7C4QL83_9PLAN